MKWECKYHVEILLKYRKKVIYGKIRLRIGEILRDLSRQKGITMEEGNAILDHIHMLLIITPKYSKVMDIRYLKGKRTMRIHREILKAQRTLLGRTFWARGNCVSTVGLNEQEIL